MAPRCSSRNGATSSSASRPTASLASRTSSATFCRTRGKQQLYREGQARQIAIAPVNTVADVLQDPQLAANGYFETQHDAILQRDLTFPGAPYRMSRTPARRQGDAPRLGEHNGDPAQRRASPPAEG